MHVCRGSALRIYKPSTAYAVAVASHFSVAREVPPFRAIDCLKGPEALWSLDPLTPQKAISGVATGAV